MTAQGGDLLSVAVDLQGPDKPRPYVEQANPDFTTVVDQDNILGPMFGYRAVPNGMFIGEDGTLVHRHFSGFDIRKPEHHAAVAHFMATGTAPGEPSDAKPFQYDHFERGLALYHAGDVDGAKKVWREGIALEPQHWNMRKQLWAVENPDRFYSGAIDSDWQKVQVEQGR